MVLSFRVLGCKVQAKWGWRFRIVEREGPEVPIRIPLRALFRASRGPFKGSSKGS